jgi:hypothetical protein
LIVPILIPTTVTSTSKKVAIASQLMRRHQARGEREKTNQKEKDPDAKPTMGFALPRCLHKKKRCGPAGLLELLGRTDGVGERL